MSTKLDVTPMDVKFWVDHGWITYPKVSSRPVYYAKRAAYQAAYRATHKEKMAEYQRLYRARQKEHHATLERP